MRKKIVAGNWKMNKNIQETIGFLDELLLKKPISTTAEIIIAPPYISLYEAVKKTSESAIIVAAQNMHQAESGAFTGEISADMLRSIGLKTVILGHSERRAYFNETDSLLSEKVNIALKHQLRIIFCFGEELKDRQQNKHFEVVKNQLTKALFHLDPLEWESIVLAYEPIWAIGTGETASPEQAQQMHAFIRETINSQFGNTVADKLTILYGGSVKPDNAKEIFSKPDVDGGLIGGAALKVEDFLAIVNAL